MLWLGICNILQSFVEPPKQCAENGFQLYLDNSAHGVTWWVLDSAGALNPNGLYKYHFLCILEKKKAEKSCIRGIKFLGPSGLESWEFKPIRA